jgi:hypothetical protein
VLLKDKDIFDCQLPIADWHLVIEIEHAVGLSVTGARDQSEIGNRQLAMERHVSISTREAAISSRL